MFIMCVCAILFSVSIICNCIYFNIQLLCIVALLGRGGYVSKLNYGYIRAKQGGWVRAVYTLLV